MQRHTPLGYKIIEGRVELNDKSAIVKEIFNDYIAGKSMNLIAKELTRKGILNANGKQNWTHVSVGKILENIKYKGDSFYPKIIDEKTFEKAQELRELKGNQLGKTTIDFNTRNRTIFSGKIKCGECGALYKKYIEHVGKKSENVKWKCKKYIFQNKVLCRNHFLTDKELEDIFIDSINQLIKQKSILKRTHQKETTKASVKLSQLENRIKQLEENEEFSSSELAELIFMRAELTYAESKIDDYEINTQKIKAKIANIEYIETFDKDIFESVVKYITVYKNKIDVELINGVIITRNLELNGKDENNGINQKNCSYNTSANKI